MMKKRNRLDSISNKIHRLQTELYDYASKIETKADKLKGEEKEKWLYIRDCVTNAGFELDISQKEIERAIDKKCG